GLAGRAGVEGAERWLAGGLAAGLLGYCALLASRRRSPRLRVGGLALAEGLATLVLAAADRPSAWLGPVLTGLAFGISALALGAATAGLLLGHWYLVTPRLSSRPLRLLCDLLLASLVPLTALAGWYLLLAN